MRPLLRRSFQPSLPRLSLTITRAASSKKKPSSPADAQIAPGSENHHDLPSFLAYAERVNLASHRTVYVGTHYEYTVAATLKRLGFHLTRTGRASDFGIDLLGAWALPIPTTKGALPRPPPLSLRVLIQCKASNKILNPKNIRELEGAFTGAPARWREEDFLGLLATTKKATKGVMDALGRSRWPMGFLKIDPDGRVEQFLWNASARARGLEGLGVTVRYSLTEKDADGDLKSDIALTWQGKPLPYVELAEEAGALPALQIDLSEVLEKPATAAVDEENVEEESAEEDEAEDKRIAEENSEEDKVEMKKGRPRKKRNSDENAAVEEKVEERVEEKTEKKKGRPRKKRDSDEDATVEEKVEEKVEEEVEKKKRRPRKKKNSNEDAA